jgi:hypothetical protein
MIGELVLIDPLWVPVLMVITGVFAAFFGNRLVAAVLALSGLALGLVHGAGIASALWNDPGFIRLGPWIFGILFAVLSGLFLRLALFFAGALLAVSAVFAFMAPPSLVVVIVAAVLGGGLACAYKNIVLALLTAAFGSLTASSGAVNLAANFSIPIGIVGYFLILAVVFTAGLLSQLRGRGRKKAESKRKRR